MELSYRAAEDNDLRSTRGLVEQAFRPEDVASFLDGLRADGCILGEWLAEDETGVVGHIVFSRVWVEREDGGRVKTALLTPLAVRPDRQRSGIGQRLMAFALEALEGQGEVLFFVLDHPEYYPKAGFQSDLGARIDNPWPGNPAFMARGDVPLEGRLIISAALKG